MSLPDATALGTLAFPSEGLPFAAYQPGAATGTLAFTFAGLPFFAQGGGGSAPVGSSARPVVFVCS